MRQADDWWYYREEGNMCQTVDSLTDKDTVDILQSVNLLSMKR